MTTEKQPQAPFTLAPEDVAATSSLTPSPPSPVEADVSLFATPDRLNLKDEAYFVFYTQQASPKRELRLLPDAHDGEKRLALCLSALPSHTSHIRRITVTLSADDGLNELQRAELSLMGADQQSKATFSLPFSTTGQDASQTAQIDSAEANFEPLRLTLFKRSNRSNGQDITVIMARQGTPGDLPWVSCCGLSG